MNRNMEFYAPLMPEKQVSDTRFGVRQFVTKLNRFEKPRIAVYMDPGRGPNGEHQS